MHKYNPHHLFYLLYITINKTWWRWWLELCSVYCTVVVLKLCKWHYVTGVGYSVSN